MIINFDTHLTPAALSKRWEGLVSVGTLGQWRSRRKGPLFVRFGGKVLYPVSCVEEFEASVQPDMTRIRPLRR